MTKRGHDITLCVVHQREYTLCVAPDATGKQLYEDLVLVLIEAKTPLQEGEEFELLTCASKVVNDDDTLLQHGLQDGGLLFLFFHRKEMNSSGSPVYVATRCGGDTGPREKPRVLSSKRVPESWHSPISDEDDEEDTNEEEVPMRHNKKTRLSKPHTNKTKRHRGVCVATEDEKSDSEEMLPLFIRNKAEELVLKTEAPASTKGSLLYAIVEEEMTRLNEICMAQGEHMELRQMSMCSRMGGELVDPNKGLFEQGFRGLESIVVHIVRSSESGK